MENLTGAIVLLGMLVAYLLYSISNSLDKIANSLDKIAKESHASNDQDATPKKP